MRLPVALIAALAAAGCAGREEATRVVVRSNRLPDGLFDRLTIEVRQRGASAACATCVREFAATELTRSGEASFSLASLDEAPVVRVTLWRSRGKGPLRASSIAVTGTFARAGDAVEVRLPWDAVGLEIGSWDDPVALDARPPLPPDPVLDAGCAVALGDDEVCVPGALFWLGDPSVNLFGGVDREGNDERLVRLSPFAIDRAEVTVGQMRASGSVYLNIPYRREANPACTFTSKPGALEDLPVTCTTWPVAEQYCRERGKRLPTEAELELLMGGRRSQRYVWGDDEPECSDAVFGDRDCGVTGPAPAGSASRDRLVIGDRAVVDLVGNTLEWASDRWNSTREGCFDSALLVDPRCDQDSPSQPGLRVVRGGGWLVERNYLGASLRSGLQGNLAYSEGVGWRCARSAAP